MNSGLATPTSHNEAISAPGEIRRASTPASTEATTVPAIPIDTTPPGDQIRSPIAKMATYSGCLA
jgi:hypothetical protein